MIINSVSVRSYRSIEDSGVLELGPVTVLIGRNNSGKSALLRAMYLAQGGAQYQTGDRRLRNTDGPYVDFTLAPPPVDPVVNAYTHRAPLPADVGMKVSTPSDDSLCLKLSWKGGEAEQGISQLSAERPNHLFVPVFARRKVGSYDNNVDAVRSRNVGVTDHDLTAWLHSLSGNHAEGRRYRELVSRVLGDETSIGTFATDYGQQPGLSISQYEHVSLDRMGEGVSSVITILAELANPGRRVLLLEEPENDLHPEALHELLNVILEAVADHGYQVLVSTHSDLVLRTLGSVNGAVVYRTNLTHSSGVPTTTYTRLDSALDRRDALADLGYEVSDPSGWLIFEESSAEAFFLHVLIPHYAPKLAGFRTVAANGTGKVKRMFEDLRRFMLFVQKSDDPEPVPRAWVLVDGDQSGRDAIDTLASTFRRWPGDRFIALSEPAIEQYYPRRFKERVATIEEARTSGVDWQAERELKGSLVRDVCAWFDGSDGARGEVQETAGELIETLRIIESNHAMLYR